MTALAPDHSHRRACTRRDDPEPTLGELLQDDTMQALMARDGVDQAQLEALIGETRRKLGFSTPQWSVAARFEAVVFAECQAA